MAHKTYENFMNSSEKPRNQDGHPMIRPTKLHCWLQIHQWKAMDANLDRIGINQKNRKKIKDATVKTNIHSLFNILKTYYVNTHQDKPSPPNTDGTDRLQLVIDTRQVLDKRPAYEDHNHAKTHSHTSHTKKNTSSHSPHPHGNSYPSLIPKVNYTDGPATTNLTKPPRTLLVISTHKNISPLPPTLPTKCPALELTKYLLHTTTRTSCSPKKVRTETIRQKNYTVHPCILPDTLSNPTHAGMIHRKSPQEDNPPITSKKEKTAHTPGNGAWQPP